MTSWRLQFCGWLLVLYLISCWGGVSTRFANHTVFSGIILTDPAVSAVLGRDFHKVPQGVNGTTAQNALIRHASASQTISQLPFAVDKW